MLVVPKVHYGEYALWFGQDAYVSPDLCNVENIKSFRMGDVSVCTYNLSLTALAARLNGLRQ